MASKGQKFRSYSAELKEIILKEYFNEVETPRTLSLKYDVPFKTIKNWITKTISYLEISERIYQQSLIYMIVMLWHIKYQNLITFHQWLIH